MALLETYQCGKCGARVQAWDEGNPYLQLSRGRRHYFYHPGVMDSLLPVLEKDLGRTLTDEEFQRLLSERIGNAPEHLCPDCSETFKLDSSKEPCVCPKCRSQRAFEIWRCEGKPCPKCGGSFLPGEMGGIS